MAGGLASAAQRQTTLPFVPRSGGCRLGLRRQRPLIDLDHDIHRAWPDNPGMYRLI